MATYYSQKVTNKLPSETGFKVNTNGCLNSQQLSQMEPPTSSTCSMAFTQLANIISTQVTQPNEQDPTIIVPLDLHNAFSMEGRQHILQHFASACPIVLNNENSKAWPSGTDGISYGNTSKPTTACQCMTGNLKFTTQKRLILFKVKQAHNHEIHLEQSFFRLLYNPSPIKLLIPILILAFVDNVCLMGPSSQVLPGVDAFATTNGPPWTQSIST